MGPYSFVVDRQVMLEDPDVLEVMSAPQSPDGWLGVSNVELVLDILCQMGLHATLPAEGFNAERQAVLSEMSLRGTLGSQIARLVCACPEWTCSQCSATCCHAALAACKASRLLGDVSNTGGWLPVHMRPVLRGTPAPHFSTNDLSVALFVFVNVCHANCVRCVP